MTKGRRSASKGKPEARPSRVHPVVHVCPLALVAETVTRTGARHLVTLLAQEGLPPTPPTIAAKAHLRLAIDDITVPQPGMAVPEAHHVRQLITFTSRWDCAAPMLIHCHAGISRSTAAAFVVMCALHPGIEPATIAVTLRRSAPWASPNARIVALADALLGRDGAMLRAIEAMSIADLGEAPRPFELTMPLG